MNRFMKKAVDEALKGVRKNHGGPFGAVIVKDGEIISKAHNEVIKNNDATDHAEMIAIREASRKLGRFNLSDCELYASCEPCPMCFAAIHWAKIKKVYYGCTKEDAANIGFDDKYIYDVIKGVAKEKQVAFKQIGRELSIKAFKEWEFKEGKVQY